MVRTSLLIALVSTVGIARADIDNAKADKLFEEALALRKINPQQACAKFAEALTYNPQAIATHLNVARCDEEQGRIASAAARYREIIDRAADQKLAEYQSEAKTRLDALVAELPHLTLAFAVAPPEGAKVLVDDKTIAVSGKTRIELDPGERRISVTAPGRVTYTTTVVVAKRDDKTLDLPALARAGSNPRRTVGKLAVVSGGALFAASVGVALVARGRYNDAAKRCPADGEGTLVCGSAEDLSQLDSAKTLGRVGTVIGIAGVASAVVGGVLWWTAPAERRTGVARIHRIDVFGGSHTAGLAVRGRF